MWRKTLTIGLAVAAMGGLAACGDDDEDDGGSAAAPAATAPAPAEGAPGDGGATTSGTLTISADDSGQLAFSEDQASATAGPTKVTFENPASVPHDLIIERDGDELAKTDVITDADASFDADLQTGSYTYFCSVAGHREAGMEGELTVE